VRDSSGQAVRDLIAADFRIFENGLPQQVAMFSGDRVPTALSLLVDTSASMQENLASAQAAASAIVGRLGPQDFTNDHQRLRDAIASTHAQGATALYNAVYIALRSLQRSRPTMTSELRREAIIVLSDGQDTASLVAFEDVLDAARRSQTLIYTIGLQVSATAAAQPTRDGQFVLRKLADQTGGRAYTVSSLGQLDNVYSEIYDTITASYMLAYVPSTNAPGGAWRTISVAVDRPGVSARTRAGYFRR
jgi:Ca-activated chloride channel family protein